jgi:dolichyl-diphosphooligosaccharide--protein glycosyltransferase
LFNKYITDKGNVSGKEVARNALLNVAICAAVVLALTGSFQWGREIRSMMSDSLAHSMEWVKDNAETEDAVVLSWWDYGYYYELESGHPVLWDGGTGTAVRLNIVGRILSTDDPKLCYSLIKMISTSGDKPVDMLTDKLGKAEGFDALYKVVVMDKDDSIKALTEEYGFGGSEAAELEALLHPSDPREVYLVMYETMTEQLGVFEYYGNWDYDGENTVPVKTVYTSMPDGSGDMSSTDTEVQEFFEKRQKEMLWRLYISGDTIKKSEVSDPEDDEASADEPAFEKVFEEDDGYVGFMIWKLSW